MLKFKNMILAAALLVDIVIMYQAYLRIVENYTIIDVLIVAGGIVVISALYALIVNHYQGE